MATLEGYEIFAELKRGPWVAIYKAFDQRRQSTVLVKMLLQQDAPAAVREQLAVESELRPQLLHANLRAIYDAGEIEGRTFVVMEYVEGPTLAEIIPQNLPFELCTWITKEVAKALAAIHHQGLLHRDVKPQNIFLSQNGEVKVGDLGLAIDRNQVAANLAGTPAYFSPELILGQSLSPSSDLFSLGAVLYEMLTAAPPFADYTTAAVLHRIANVEPMPPEKVRRDIPPELASLCRKLLAKNPQQRCQSAEETINFLSTFEQQYQLRLSQKDLSQYLQQPATYARAQFLPPAPRLAAEMVSPRSPKPEQLSRKRRLVPLLFTALVLCGFILFNFEDKATEHTRLVLPRVGEAALQHAEANPKPALANAARTHASERSASLDPNKSEAVPRLEAEAGPRRTRASAAEPGANSHPVALAEKVDPPSVLLLSEPRAQVFVENDSLGLTPVRWRPQRADEVYELRFVTPVLPRVSKLVTATILESDTLRLNLWKEFAYLEIIVHPWGEIWIDGKPVDTTPLAAPLTLPPGLHELNVRHPQLGAHSQRLILTKGDTLRKVVNLLAP